MIQVKQEDEGWRMEDGEWLILITRVVQPHPQEVGLRLYFPMLEYLITLMYIEELCCVSIKVPSLSLISTSFKKYLPLLLVSFTEVIVATESGPRCCVQTIVKTCRIFNRMETLTNIRPSAYSESVAWTCPLRATQGCRFFSTPRGKGSSFSALHEIGCWVVCPLWYILPKV